MSAGESGDVQAEVHIEVTGASSLDDAAKSAQDLSDGLDEVAASAEAATGSVGELGGELDDLGAAAPGIEADGEAIGHIRDEAAGASPAVAALAAKLDALNSGGRKPESGGMMQTLTDIRDFMADMERGEKLTIFKGMQGGFGSSRQRSRSRTSSAACSAARPGPRHPRSSRSVATQQVSAACW